MHITPLEIIVSIVYFLIIRMDKKTLFIDYPREKKRGRIANTFMRSMTILAIFLMIIGSVKSIESAYYTPILWIEFAISCIFLIDFLIRAYLSRWKKAFFTNIFNIFDLIASVPFIVAVVFHGHLALGYLKVLRITRICRIFRLGKYFMFLTNFRKALKKNAYKYKIASIFFLLCWLLSSFLMYAIEWAHNPGYTDIPTSMWWALVTMSTVWYGDIFPITLTGKIVGGLVILLWPIFLAIISSVSIVTFLDVVRFINKEKTGDALCEKCKTSSYENDAQYCRICWEKLSSSTSNNYILDNY